MEVEVRSSTRLWTLVLVAVLIAVAPGVTQAQLKPNDQTQLSSPSPEMCALLDSSERALMDGLLMKLVYSCGRAEEFFGEGGIMGERPGVEALATDAEVNDQSNDTGHPSITQSETSMAENPITGTLCAGYNDSCEFFCPGGGGGFTGFSRSTDGGATWVDKGALSADSFGDPSIVWRESDGDFYFAALSGAGLGLWNSTDDCQTFSFVSTPATSGDDKELIQIDNWGGSPNYGNIYLVWTDFGVGGSPIRAVRSTDGGVSWSSATTVSSGGVVQGAWPTVTPTGDVFVAWLRYTDFINGPIHVDVAKSTNGGLTYSAVTSPLSNAVSPRDNAATGSCGRPALKGNIRYLASPQIEADGNGFLHVVYSYDPDGFNTGDVSDVFYRRSTDGGTTWETEVRLNDDATNSDQYFPTIKVNGSTIMATWYDRRLDNNNLMQDTYKSVSVDGGVTWGANERVSDVSSPIVLDPNLATCYHGDYDQTLLPTSGSQVAQWADDRAGNPNVFSDTDGGGGGIPCEDLDKLQARCQSREGPQHRLQARVIFTDSSHDGESVTFNVDGSPTIATVSGDKAQINVNGVASGSHTVDLTDPAGCFPPKVVECELLP